MLIIYAILTCLMITVCLSDAARFLIPNWLVLALIVLYPIAVYISPARPDWHMACLITFCVFIIGYIFLFRWMGGGDVKLLTAASLYTGGMAFLDFIVYVAIIGGIGTLLLLVLRLIAPYIFLKLGKSGEAIPRVLTSGEPAPYGVAIAASFLILLWEGHLPGLVLYK